VVKKLNPAEIAKHNPKVDVSLAKKYREIAPVVMGDYETPRPLGDEAARSTQKQPRTQNRAALVHADE
jgi:hypothetical protein